MPELSVDILGNAGALEDALGSADSKLDRFGKKAQSVGKGMTKYVTAPIVGATAAVGAMALKVIGLGDQIQLLADKSGLSTTAIQELTHAGGIAGTEIDAITNASGRFAKVVGDSERGLATATDALDKLGIKVRDNNGNMRTQDELFNEAIVALQGLEDETTKMALAQEVFGRGGREMLPILNMTQEQFAGLRKEAHDLGTVMSEDSIKALDSMDDELTRITGSLKGVGMQIAQDAIPVMQDMIAAVRQDVVPWLVRAGKTVGGLIKWFQGLSPEVKTVIGVITGLAAVAGPLAVVIGTVAAVVSGPLLLAIGAAVAIIGTVTAAIVYWDEIVNAVKASIDFLWKILKLTPLGLIIGLIQDVIKYMGGWDEIVKKLGETWDWLVGVFKESFAFISDTIGAVSGWFGDAMDGIKSAAGDMADTVTGVFKDVDDSAKKHFVESTVLTSGVMAMQGITIAAQAMGKNLDEVFQSSDERITGMFDSVIGKVEGVFGEKGGGVYGMVKNLFGTDGKLTAMLGPAGPFVGAAITMAPKLIGVFKDAVGKIKGLWSGIKGLFGGGGPSDELLAQQPLMAQREVLDAEIAAVRARLDSGRGTSEDYARYDELRLQIAELNRQIDLARLGQGAIPAATGFHGMVTRPTMFLAGEAGPERVDITPGMGGMGGGTVVNVTVYGNVGSRDLGNEITRQVDRAGYRRG